MKLKKKSGLMGAVIALSAASLVSVGFASWVITQGDEEVVAGTIQADAVSANKNYAIEFTDGVDGSNNLTDKIIFGSAAFDTSITGLTNYHWLSNDDKLDGANGVSSAENLTAVCTFTVGEVTSSTSVTGSGTDLTIADGLGYHVTAELDSDDYVTTVGGVANVLGDLPDPELSFNAGVFTCTITFAWGEHFTVTDSSSENHIVNPMTYYNSKAVTPELATEANTVLTALNTLMNDLSYNLTIKVAIPEA